MKRHLGVQSKRAISKRKKRVLASLAMAGVACGGPAARADMSTTLIGIPGSVVNDPVPLNHGSTAETALTWSAVAVGLPHPNGDWDQYPSWNGRGDVYQIDQLQASIAFAPTAPNIKLTIDSFELDEWAGGGDTAVEWSVTGSSSGLLASGTWVDMNTANDPNDLGGRTLLSPMTMGIAGETLTLLFDQSASGGTQSYLAMDNLTFSSQVVPEPSTMMIACLGVGGLGAMAMRRKRR